MTSIRTDQQPLSSELSLAILNLVGGFQLLLQGLEAMFTPALQFLPP